MDWPEEVEAVSNPWSLAIFLGVAAVLIGINVAGSRLFTGTHTARRSFWCPFRHRDVQADFSESEWDGSLVDVQACTAFKPPTDVGCDKACLSLNLQERPRIRGSRYWPGHLGLRRAGRHESDPGGRFRIGGERGA